MVTDVHWNMRNQPAARCAQQHQHKNLPLKRFERKIFTLPKAHYGPVCWHHNWSYLIANLTTCMSKKCGHQVASEIWPPMTICHFPIDRSSVSIEISIELVFLSVRVTSTKFQEKVRQLRTPRPNDRTPCHVHMGSIKTVTLQVLAAGHFPHL